jgi:hypothetical protein
LIRKLPNDTPRRPLRRFVIAGLRILGLEEGLPRLPDLEFAIYEMARPEKTATALAAALLALGRSPARPTI